MNEGDREAEGATAPPPKVDRSAQIKDAIRASAARRFVADGFAGTGIRDIARDADVDPAIVIRHFGSKEALFLATISLPESWAEGIRGPIEKLGYHVASTIAAARDGGIGTYAALIRASENPGVDAQLRVSVAETFVAPIAQRLKAPDAELRARFFVAQMEGLLLALAVRKDPILLALPADELVAQYGAFLQHTLTGGRTVDVREEVE